MRNRQIYIITFAFIINLIIKNICFQFFYCGTLLSYQSLLITISTALFISSFVTITKNRIWTIVFSIILDLWIIANMFYFRANNLLISVDSILMADNLNSYLASLKAYICRSMIVPPATTTAYATALYLINETDKKRHFKIFLALMLLSICFSIGGKYERWHNEMNEYKEQIDFYISNGGCNTPLGQDHLYGKFGYKLFIPFSYANQLSKWGVPIETYIVLNDITNFFPATLVYYFSKSDYSATDIDEQSINHYINTDTQITTAPKYNLLVILCESLESWVLESINKTYIMPNLNSFMHRHNALYLPRIKSQARHGVSGDGQMTVCTGLLPLQNGAACLSFGSNTYPNIASYYNGSNVITPDCGWNQEGVSGSYGFKDFEFCKDDHWADDSIMIKTTQCINNIEKPFYCLSVTFSMHTPFNHISNSALQLPTDLPSYMKGYLNCAHYTDSCMNILFSYMENNNILDSTIVIITGDHTIFKSQMLNEFYNAAEKYNLSIANGSNYCPLIIVSPEFKNYKQIDDLCYQMDIFPTICHLIGYDNFYWKGFGVNLLDSAAIHNRETGEDEAYKLSDQIIRSNYFQKYK